MADSRPRAQKRLESSQPHPKRICRTKEPSWFSQTPAGRMATRVIIRTYCLVRFILVTPSVGKLFWARLVEAISSPPLKEIVTAGLNVEDLQTTDGSASLSLCNEPAQLAEMRRARFASFTADQPKLGPFVAKFAGIRFAYLFAVARVLLKRRQSSDSATRVDTKPEVESKADAVPSQREHNWAVLQRTPLPPEACFPKDVAAEAASQLATIEPTLADQLHARTEPPGFQCWMDAELVGFALFLLAGKTARATNLQPNQERQLGSFRPNLQGSGTRGRLDVAKHMPTTLSIYRQIRAAQLVARTLWVATVAGNELEAKEAHSKLLAALPNKQDRLEVLTDAAKDLTPQSGAAQCQKHVTGNFGSAAAEAAAADLTSEGSWARVWEASQLRFVTVVRLEP